MLEAVIFDLDGTLWDASEPIAMGWNKAFEKRGLSPITSEDVRGVCGLPMDEILRVLQPEHATKELLEEIIHLEEEILETVHGSLYPGMLETLEALKEKYKLYIVSNCQSGYIELFLRTLNLSSYFEDAECWGNTKNPKGQNIKDLMERNSIKHAIYVGDTLGDQRAAKEAGVPFYFAAYGFGESTASQGVLQEPMDLIQALEGC